MSVITTKFERTPIMSAVSTAASFVRRAAVKSARLFIHAVDAIAEARMQRAKLEAELYRNRYRHTSKNDDDLPVVRPSVADDSSRPFPSMNWLRARAIALAKRAYPAALVFAIFGVIIVATIALRIAIWLPISAHFKAI